MTNNTNTSAMTLSADVKEILAGGYLCYRDLSIPAGELFCLPEAKPIHVEFDLEVSIINELHKILNGEEVDVVRLFSFFTNDLTTSAILKTKKTTDGNVAFIIETRWNNCTGIYGDVQSELTLPEPLSQGRPSYPCFHGWSGEDPKWVGVVMDAFTLDRLKLDVGAKAETNVSFVLHVDLGYFDNLMGLDDSVGVIVRGDHLLCNWQVAASQAAATVETICKTFDMTIYDLYKIKCESDIRRREYLVSFGKEDNTRNFNSKDYEPTRFYSTYVVSKDTIVFH